MVTASVVWYDRLSEEVHQGHVVIQQINHFGYQTTPFYYFLLTLQYQYQFHLCFGGGMHPSYFHISSIFLIWCPKYGMRHHDWQLRLTHDWLSRLWLQIMSKVQDDRIWAQRCRGSWDASYTVLTTIHSFGLGGDFDFTKCLCSFFSFCDDHFAVFLILFVVWC